MAMEVDQFSFKRLSLRRFPRLEKRESGEESFWRKFQFPIVVKEYAAVSSVHFSPTSPHDFSVTSGSRIQVYSGITNQVKKTISRFKEVAYSGCFRHDGKLLAAGSEVGVVKVFDVNSRAILRTCRGHSKPVKTVCFSLDGLRLFSGSNDTTVRFWDVATEACIGTLGGHEDYVRSILPNPASSDLLLSGSYDHTVRLWDLRSHSTVLELDHGAPVEAILMFPSGGTCLSAGGNYVKVWDVLSGGRLLVAFSSHQKTITALSFDGSCQRLLSAGLDKQLKVYSVEDYRVVHSMSYPAPILSMAMSSSDNHVVVGMTNRLLSIKRRPHKPSEDTLSFALPDKPRGGTYRYFVRGRTYKPSSDEYVVTMRKKDNLKQYEAFLKKFKYKDAVDAALKTSYLHTGSSVEVGHLASQTIPMQVKGSSRGLVVYSLFQELARRDGLTIALSGRNEMELRPLLHYLIKFMTLPKYAPLLLDICNIVVDIYGSTLWHSRSMRDIFATLKHRIDRELKFQRQAFQLLGALDAILTAAMATQRQSTAARTTLDLTEHQLKPT